MAVRVGEEHGDAGVDGELRVSGQLLASVPGQGANKALGQRPQDRLEGVFHGDGAVAAERWSVLDWWLDAVALEPRKVDQQGVAGGAFHDGADR